MESQALRSAVRRLRQVVSVPPVGPDAELLRAFAGRRDAGAFEQIVRRHGPMVLGVCRRVLRNPADADDAFQATFLVLVRKAGSLRAPDRLAGWLHQVAHRVARKARAMRMNRARREGELFDVPIGEPPAEIVWRELRPIFDAELARLPDRLRLPAVLCFLEGHSKAEAARALGWPEGTLSCRLQRAREKLRVRLAARGLTLSAGALVAALFEGAGSAAVPDRLIASTIQSVMTTANAAAVRALADGVTQAMFLAKVKAAMAAVLVVGAFGTGTGVALVPGGGPVQVAAGEPKNSTPPTRPAAAPPRTDLAPQSEADLLKQELLVLKERLAWEERMVAKGFLSSAQVDKTKLEVARLERAFAKAVAPPAPDPRRQAMEATVRKLEEIVEQNRLGVKKGIIPLQELLNSEATLARYKFELAALDERPAARPAAPTAEQRSALGAVVKKMEEIVAQTEEGVKKGVIPQQELLNAQLKLLEYKFKLAELTPPAADPRAATPPPVSREAASAIAAKEKELERAERLLKERAVSGGEVSRLRSDLHRLKGEAATARGDYAAAVRESEAVVAELEARAKYVRALVDAKAAPRGELRAADVAVAEARVEAFKAGVRAQLASIIGAREEELRELRALSEAKVVSSDELRRAERAVADARARLAAER